ncbi:MAG: DUF4268 domain-containing protein [Candidatus Poribacteria bacterium]|nr:DUF4268 domain-containing protein [Candidatus Poribacteria bacterium]
MPKLGRLQPVELREIWADEAADFTPWLAREENLALLGETLGMELELEAQEINVGDFQADILCRNTEDDSRVLIENQLERTDHDHLGKTLTYSAGLDADTVVWIARRFREEHRAALDRLNEITGERFRYFGIEIKVWQIGSSDRAPQFEIVSKPNDWHREVSQRTQRVRNENLTETQLLRKKFWTTFRDYMIQKGSPIKYPEPGPGNYLNCGIGQANFGIGAYQNTQDKFIATMLYLGGNDAKPHFYLLREQKEEIENEFGERLEWEERPEHKESRISLQKTGTDPTNETDWSNQHEWIRSKVEKFHQVFCPRVEALNAAGWKPSENEDNE